MKITKEYGHWRLPLKIRQLLLECKANDSTRYALSSINVSKKALATTDGHRLVEIEVEHKIEPGNYFCTSDGFLLDTTEDKFPEYKDIIPAEETLRKIVDTTGDWEKTAALILGELCHAGCICKLSLYQAPVEILSGLITDNVRVFVDKKEPKDRPFIIEGNTDSGYVRYIQMPVHNVENEAKTET